MQKRALVTGATGFIGSHLAEELLKRGYYVRCLARQSSNLQWLEGLPVERVSGSLSDESSLYKAVENVDIVFHVAGLTAARTREEFFHGNQVGTRNLLNAVLNVNGNLDRFLHVSSQTAVGPSPSRNQPIDENSPCKPITAYGESKKAAEDEVLAVADRMKTTIIRLPAVFGPRDTAIFDFFKTVNSGIAPLIGFDEKFVSLVHSADVAQGLFSAAESENTIGKKYYVSSEEFYTWKQISGITAKALGKNSVLNVRIPHPLVMGIAGISEFFGRFSAKPPVLNYEKGKDLIQQFWICSVEAAQRDFGYRQTMSLEEGIVNTVAWYKKHGWL